MYHVCTTVAGTAQCPTGTKTQPRPPNSEFHWDRPHPQIPAHRTALGPTHGHHSPPVAHWSNHSQGSQGKREAAPCCSVAPYRPRPTRKKKTEHERRSNTRRRQVTLFWYCWWSYETIGEKKSFGIVQIGLEPAGLNRRRVRSRVRS